MQCACFISLNTTLYHLHQASSVPRLPTSDSLFHFSDQSEIHDGSGQRAAGEGRRNLRFAVLGDRRVGR